MVLRQQLGSVLAPYSHCSSLTEIPLAGEARLENDLIIAPGATLDLTNLTII